MQRIEFMNYTNDNFDILFAGAFILLCNPRLSDSHHAIFAFYSNVDIISPIARLYSMVTLSQCNCCISTLHTVMENDIANKIITNHTIIFLSPNPDVL